MDIRPLLLLTAAAAILTIATKLGAIAVSAPNDSYAAVMIYTAFSILMYFVSELLGLQKKPRFLPPLFSLDLFWLVTFVIGFLILKFWVTMWLFGIGKLRALCLMIAITVLVTLTTRVLTSGLKNL